MADKNWGIKIFCECGAKYYSMNKKDNIICPTCSAAYVPEDLNAKPSPIAVPRPISLKISLDADFFLDFGEIMNLEK